MSQKQLHKRPVISPRVLRRLAESENFKITGKHKKALEIAEQVLIDDPMCVEAAEEVADNLLSLHWTKKAEKAAKYVLKLDRESFIGHFVSGFIASEKEDWKQSVVHFQKSNEGQPNNPEILRCLGWSMFHAGFPDEGTASLQRALSLRDDDPAILCDLAACYLQKNYFLEAISLLKKAIEIDSEDLRVQELLDVAHRLQSVFMSEEL